VENGIPTTPEQVLVTNGGKQALYNLFQVLLGPGDELLLPAPYWLSYPEMAQLAGATVRRLPTEARDGFPGSCPASWRRRSPQPAGCSCSTAPPIPPAW